MGFKEFHEGPSPQRCDENLVDELRFLITDMHPPPPPDHFVDRYLDPKYSRGEQIKTKPLLMFAPQFF